MKVLLDMPDDFRDWALDWVECQGAKLEANQDGSFKLVFSRDLTTSREAEARLRELLRGPRDGRD